MRFANKAWNNVTQQTIPNCFRHCGFVKEKMMSVEQDKEELIPNDVVETYNIIPGKGELSFEEFIHFDDNTVVAGALTDEEILAEVNVDKSVEAGLNNEDEIEDVPTVTRKDARQAHAVLMRYFQQHSGTGDNTFTALVNIENKINLLCKGNIIQKKITNYFKKLIYRIVYLFNLIFLTFVI